MILCIYCIPAAKPVNPVADFWPSRHWRDEITKRAKNTLLGQSLYLSMYKFKKKQAHSLYKKLRGSGVAPKTTSKPSPPQQKKLIGKDIY